MITFLWFLLIENSVTQNPTVNSSLNVAFQGWKNHFCVIHTHSIIIMVLTKCVHNSNASDNL